MGPLPTSVVLLIYFNLITGHTLLRDDKHEIKWPSKYHFKVDKFDLIKPLKESKEIWYSAELNRSRIDSNGGIDKIYYYADTGYSYEVNPKTTENVTNEIICSSSEFASEPIKYLHNVSNLKYTGETLNLYDKVVEVWVESIKYRKIKGERTLYVHKTDSGIYVPVQEIVKIYKLDIGKLLHHVITNFYEFWDTISKEDLTYKDEKNCRDKRLREDFKTALKFYHPDIPIELDKAFESYSNHRSKQYHEEEHQMRKKIFENNWRMVEEHNRKNLSFRMELNEFSVWTDDELKYLTGTYVSRHEDLDLIPFPYTLEEIDDLVKELPENFDLRMEGVISSVKNQGQCLSCWAFGATATVEGALARANGGRLLDLSEQSLIDCAWGFYNMGCDGGTLDGALKYVLKHGIPTEEKYGIYEANDGFCRIQNMTELYKIRGFAAVPPRSPNALKVALHKYGPVAGGVHASKLMMLYANGVFYDISCDEKSELKHAVTVVGYGVRDGEDYWVVKNSWGENWGMDGYILMSAKNNNCRILDYLYYAIV